MTQITKLQHFSVPSPTRGCYSSFYLQVYAMNCVRTSLMETSYLQSVMPVCTSQVAVHSMSVQTYILYEVTD